MHTALDDVRFVTFLAMHVAIIVCLGFYLFRLGRTHQIKGLRMAAAIQPLCSIAKKLKETWSPVELHPLDAKISKLLAERRVERFRQVCSGMVHVMAAASAFYFCRNIVNVWKDEDQQSVSKSLFVDGTIGILWYFVLCLLSVFLPQRVSPRFIDGSYIVSCSWQILRCFGGFAALGPQLIHVHVLPELVATRVLVGLLVCNIRLTSVASIIVSAASAAGALAYPMPGEEGMAAGIVVRQIYWTLVSMFFWGMFEHWTWTKVKVELEATASSQAVSTTRHLLNSLCDAVVVVRGRDFRIDEPAPKLDAMLLRQGAPGRVKDMSFLDFVHEADHARVLSFLNSVPGQNDEAYLEPATALQVHLRHQWSTNGIRVQLFRTHFVNVYDQHMHMIGICEVGDMGAALPDAAADVDVQHIPGHPSRWKSVHSESSNAPASLESQVMMDALSFKVLDGTTGFGDFLARLHEGNSFLDLLEDRSAFAQWIQEYVQNELYGRSPTSGCSRMATFRSGQAAVTTVCTIQSCLIDEEVGDCEGPPSELPVCLSFSGFKRRHGRSRQRISNEMKHSRDVQSGRGGVVAMQAMQNLEFVIDL